MDRWIIEWQIRLLNWSQGENLMYSFLRRSFLVLLIHDSKSKLKKRPNICVIAGAAIQTNRLHPPGLFSWQEIFSYYTDITTVELPGEWKPLCLILSSQSTRLYWIRKESHAMPRKQTRRWRSLPGGMCLATDKEDKRRVGTVLSPGGREECREWWERRRQRGRGNVCGRWNDCSDRGRGREEGREGWRGRK